MKFTGTCALVAGCLGLLTPGFSLPQAQGPSATEKVAKRLEELLQPGGKSAALTGGPVAWPGPKTVESPQMSPAPYSGQPPPPPNPPGKPASPRPLPEGAPPETAGLPPLPGPVKLLTKPLARVPATDVESPLALPILAKPKADRASLDDTTMEASQAAALRPLTPERKQHEPFVPLNLPDPFEHARTGGLRNPPEESPNPPTVPVETPRK
jgi:hypothetical protein